MCGPETFLRDVSTALGELAWTREPSGRRSSAAARRSPRASRRRPGARRIPRRVRRGTGPRVVFARSGLTVPWRPGYGSLIDLAEACDVPARWSCRTGVCHTWETDLLSGAVAYEPDPVEPPAEGGVLVCCSRPTAPLVLDL